MNLFWQVIHLSNSFHILPLCVREERSPIFLRLGMIRTQAPGSRHQHDENNIKVYYDREIRYFLCKKVLKVILYVPKYLLMCYIHTTNNSNTYLGRYYVHCIVDNVLEHMQHFIFKFQFVYLLEAGLNYNNKIIN